VPQFQQKNPTGPLLWPLAPALKISRSHLHSVDWHTNDWRFEWHSCNPPLMIFLTERRDLN